MRKLASIQKIVKLEPIIGADKIEKATVLGWELVVKKGEFNIDDLCVYCEVDSVLPEKSEFEFLRERKFRIKTIKLKGQISMGIAFPLTILPKTKVYQDLGTDVTEILGITKYETPSERQDSLQQQIKAGKVKRFLMKYNWFRQLIYNPAKLPLPNFIKKTDETRIQNMPGICQDLAGLPLTVTEKLDGQSATYFCIKSNKKVWQFWLPEFIFGVCSRNFWLVKEELKTNWWKIARKINIKDKLLEYCKQCNAEIYIQGEIIGYNTQGNKYNISNLDFRVFNIVDLHSGMADVLQQAAICSNMGLKQVPYLGVMFLPATIKEAVELAKGKSKLADTLREGIVVRDYKKNISFKIINPDFLLKYDL
jgi:hypothetical protein